MVSKKKMNNINVEVSTLGFGGMRFPTINNEIDQEKLDELVDYAIKNGINYFDTAYVYHGGKSEGSICKSLRKYNRNSYFVADKMPEWELRSKEDVERIFNEQLKRTGLDYIDFYLAHSLEPENYEKFKRYDVYSFMKKKQEEGKIKHIGFSFHGTPELLEEILSNYKFDFVQIQLNYYDWTIQRAKEQYEILEKYHMPCIVMEGARGGFLSNFNDDINKIFKDNRPNDSISSWAFRWLISLPNVYVVLSGMSNMEQLEDNIKTFTKYEKYTENDYKVLDKALKKLYENKIIPCTGCRYCMDCSHGVDIPRVFAIYNDYCRTQNSFMLGVTYGATLSDKNKPSYCKECGLCKTKCPQHIDIPRELKRVEKEIEEIVR